MAIPFHEVLEEKIHSQWHRMQSKNVCFPFKPTEIQFISDNHSLKPDMRLTSPMMHQSHSSYLQSDRRCTSILEV